MARKMSHDELVSIIKANRRDSLGVEDGTLSNERATAMDHYHGRPYGNEEEGRSAVVSKDLAEAVDWAMPAIMDVFVRSGNICEFEPIGPEDEEQARQESDYTNQVIMTDNDGFMLLHDAVKDTLLLKNGYVKHKWEENEQVKEDEYEGLSADEVAMLLQEKQQKGYEVEITGQDERLIEIDTPEGPMGFPVFDIKVRCVKKHGRVVIEAVPAEEIRVSKRCRGSLQNSPFVEHVTRKTRTDLLEMGMSAEFVNDLPAYNERENDTEQLARDSLSDEHTISGASINDRSMDEIEFCEAYIRVDWDADGKAELRKVVTCADKVPPGPEWNEPISAVPITGFVAKRVPHRHVGESLDDDLSDLQEIKTALLRQMLDNIYRTNSSEIVLNESANISDFMQSLPGGIKRIKGREPVQGAVMPLPVQSILGQVLPAIDYIDNLKESRTGINRATTGLDPDILKQTTKGAFMENLNRASQKIQMMIRMIAESGVKEMVRQVHALLIKHQDKARVVKMRGHFVSVNPSEWEERTDLTLRVGLGTGTEEEKREKLMLVNQLQDKLLSLGLVEPEQAFALFAEIAETLGMQRPEKYALDPTSPEYAQVQQRKAQQPPPKDPTLIATEMKLQADAQKFQAETARQQAADDKKAMLDIQKFQAEAEVNRQQAEQAMQQELVRSNNDVAIEREKIAAQMELERYKIEKKAQTDILIAQMQAEMDERRAAREAERAEWDAQLHLQMHSEKLAAMTKPKSVKYGPDGRPTGIE